MFVLNIEHMFPESVEHLRLSDAPGMSATTQRWEKSVPQARAGGSSLRDELVVFGQRLRGRGVALGRGARAAAGGRCVAMRGVGWALLALVLGVGLGVVLRSPAAVSKGGSYAGHALGSVAGSDLRSASAVMYVVRPGDTLWSIARSIDPTGDERPLVDQLASQLHGTVIYPGEQLELPAAP